MYNETESRPRKSPVKKFFKVVFITLGICIAFFAAAIFGFSALFGENPVSQAVAKMLDSNLERNNILDVFDSVPDRTNFVILGLDEGGTRTDVIMVCSLDAKTKRLDIISVPRDTYATIPQERRQILKDNNLNCPTEMKINAVNHYAKELGTEFIVKQLEDIFDIKISYYIKIDLKAFREVVDEMGGIEFNVPQRMYYRDPVQGLYIDLQPGLQKLNGEQAEGLVRYRKSDQNNPVSKGYTQGDIKRVEVQRDFLKACITQVMSKSNFIKNAPSLFATAVKHVKTNFSAADVVKYAQVFSSVSSDNIFGHTVPHSLGDIGSVNYVIIDKEETKQMMNEIFNPQNGEGNTPVNAKSEKEMSILLLNGGYVSGLASKTREYLTNEGYNVVKIGDYTIERNEKTRIIVRDKKYGTELKKLLDNSEIEINKDIEPDYDIVIILGTKAN